MNQTPIDQRLLPIIAKHVTADESLITADACLIDDLGADSLDIVELVMDIEDEFRLEIPDDHIGGMETPGDVKRYLIKRLGAQVIGAEGETA